MIAALAAPFPGAVITTHFGQPNAANGQPHTGTDYAYGGSSCGRPVLAAAPGVARRSENLGGGHGVLIDHGGGTETGYWHLATQLVGNGQQVKQGQVIGMAGASGTLVKGCHLHFEVKQDGQNLNPEQFVGAGPFAAIPNGSPDSYPRDKGQSCPPGYVAATVNPQAHGWLPGSPWFGRPTEPDGTILACVRQGLQPGDNTALTDVGQGVTEALGAVVPFLANAGVIFLALFLGWQGVRRVTG